MNYFGLSLYTMTLGGLAIANLPLALIGAW